MIASERLGWLSRKTGVPAGVMLLSIGTGTTAGDILRNHSGLSYGSAAEHLLVDVAEDEDSGGFDAPYREYVKRVTEQRAAEYREATAKAAQEQGAFIDSLLGKGSSRVIDAVAPSLSIQSQQILIDGQGIVATTATTASTKGKRKQPAVANEDEAAAMLAMFMLMQDED